MHEFKSGKLKSSSGDLVTDRSQALAIALRGREYEEGGEVGGESISLPPNTTIQDLINEYDKRNGDIRKFTIGDKNLIAKRKYTYFF